MFEFGGAFAWFCVPSAILLVAAVAVAAAVQPLNPLVRPLAFAGLVVSTFTLANALHFLRDWDAAGTYAMIVSSGPVGSRAEALGALLIPLWPYGAVAFGAAFGIVYGAILCNRAAFIELFPAEATPSNRAGRARERESFARWWDQG